MLWKMDYTDNAGENSYAVSDSYRAVCCVNDFPSSTAFMSQRAFNKANYDLFVMLSKTATDVEKSCLLASRVSLVG